jgi:hypothetical protein
MAFYNLSLTDNVHSTLSGSRFVVPVRQEINHPEYRLGYGLFIVGQSLALIALFLFGPE